MNGKYYGKREIRWQSREKDRLEHIHKRKDEDESTCRGCPNMGHITGSDFGSVSAEPMARSPHRDSSWR